MTFSSRQIKDACLELGRQILVHLNRLGNNLPLMQGSLVVLTVLVVLSSMSLIYAKHTSRQLFAKIQALHEEQEAYGREWTQLLLEQGTWASNARVEKKAKENLDMGPASTGNIVVIKEIVS